MSAAIGGRVAAPEDTGRIVGTGFTVRNYLQGVANGDGDVAIALQGTSARIERFTARAGTGSVALERRRAPRRSTARAAQPRGRPLRAARARRPARRHERHRGAHARPQNLVFDGRSGVDEGLIDFSKGDAPSLGGDVEVVRRPDAPAPTTAT